MKVSPDDLLTTYESPPERILISVWTLLKLKWWFSIVDSLEKNERSGRFGKDKGGSGKG